MKKIHLAAGALALAVFFTAGQLSAMQSKYSRSKGEATQAAEKADTSQDTTADPPEKKSKPQFPENGWHKGPYLALHGGFMQATNDTNLVTKRSFDGKIIPAFGLTFGWDIADWIGPMLQMTYATATGQVGDGLAADTPIEDGREHAINFSLFARATLPYFTHAGWQSNSVKIIPYVKLGGTAHALYVKARSDGNKTGAFGGGVGLGAGVELYIWKGFFFAIDFTENLIFQKAEYKTVHGVPNSKILDGGMKAQANVLGLVGWHF